MTGGAEHGSSHREPPDVSGDGRQPDAPSVTQIGARTFDFRSHVAVMAIINRTRDSFFDRGRTFSLDAALAAGRKALEEGADWLDIGGVPFSPLAESVSVQEELDRVLPVVTALRSETDAVLSVDTFRPEVAREALAGGADAVNDTSGIFHEELADVIARAGASIVVTHSKAAPVTWLPRPSYDDVVTEVREFLWSRARFAIERGIDADHIILDPGHDLNKNTLHSLELTRRLGELSGLGFPLLASVSNKDFIQETLGLPRGELAQGNVATLSACILGGARIVRVHDVQSTVRAVRMLEAILGFRAPVMLRHNVE
jgi:dihydropteroate synthase